jgi:haloalkane dehalogenase
MMTTVPAWLDRREFPFAPTLVDVGDGERLSVTDVGSGPPVLFSHGTPTWSYEWRRLIGPLSNTRRCVAPDHLGFGLSPRPSSSDYGPASHARRFRRLLDALHIDRYSLVVHDFGGPIALDAAVEHPERIETLVILNSFAWPFGDSARTALMARLAGTHMFRWLYRRANMSFVIARSAWGDRSSMTAHTWQPYLHVFPDPESRERVLFALARSMAGDRPFFERLGARLPRLSHTRIHLIWGMRDSAFPPRVLSKFQSVWPHATTVTLDSAGHWPHEEQPDLCVSSLLEVIDPTASSRKAPLGGRRSVVSG